MEGIGGVVDIGEIGTGVGVTFAIGGQPPAEVETVVQTYGVFKHREASFVGRVFWREEML